MGEIIGLIPPVIIGITRHTRYQKLLDVSRMAYTQVDAADITNLYKSSDPDDNMVFFDYKGIRYAYYLADMEDTYWGMVEENDITLNPYTHEEDRMYKTGKIGWWDKEKKTAMFKTSWLNSIE